jgi:ABC-type ATPase with predicted acetyltransferase domain
MFLREETEVIEYQRISKLGNIHKYLRERTLAVFRCDNCGEIFRRERSKMSPKRLSNNYFHCCSNCDAKRFAQRKGVEHKKIWDMKASSLDDVAKL